MENSVLVDISENIGLGSYVVDRRTPVVKPQSDYVAAGTKYQTEMFMVATSSSLKPQMEFGSSNLKVNEDGIGSLNFVASGGNYNANCSKRRVLVL